MKLLVPPSPPSARATLVPRVGVFVVLIAGEGCNWQLV
jgi:hypothetical protein